MSYYPGQRRGSQHVMAFVLFFIGIGLTIGLYYVKTRAQSAKLEVARMERLVAAEKVTLNVLKAEIAHLESPVRVAALAETELGLEPVTTDQVITAREIAERFELLPSSDVEPLALSLSSNAETRFSGVEGGAQ